MTIITLYGYWRSSTTWRVRIALNMKGLTYAIVPVHLVEAEQHTVAHKALNPMAQVPVLAIDQETDTAVTLTQSMAIMEFLDEHFTTGAPLLPSDTVARARVRQLAEVINSGIQPVQNFAVLKRLKSQGIDARAWASDFIRNGLTAVEAIAAQTPGQFLVGDQPSIADLCLIPQLYNARRFNTPIDDLTTLLAVEAQCNAREAFQRAHPDRQPDAQSAS
ncbi:MAG: maleylacetoacetate isomerase [Myxococcota bacterium]